MDKTRILIMGGYGHTGLPLAKLLLQETDAPLTLAGRNVDRAKRTAQKLNSQYPGERVTGAYVDASHPDSLHQVMGDSAIVVVASSTAQYVRQVAAAAMACGIDYLDVQYSSEKINELKELAGEISVSGLCFITDGGFHPGLPAALVYYMTRYFDRLEVANVGSAIKINWRDLNLSPATMEEFVGEFMDFKALAFKDGSWENLGLRSMFVPNWMDFGPPIGRQYCMPMFLEEMRAVPEMVPSLQETGFFVGGLNWFVDWFLSPLIIFGLRLFPDKGRAPMGKLMNWSLRNFSKPPYGTLIKVEAEGIKDGKAKTAQMTLAHDDGYMMTAIPVAACLLQYLEGSIRKPGLWYQAHIVEPQQFVSDIERLGVKIDFQET